MFCLVSVENCFEKSASRRKFISSLKVWRREVVNLLAEILILFLNKEMDVFYFLPTKTGKLLVIKLCRE